MNCKIPYFCFHWHTAASILYLVYLVPACPLFCPKRLSCRINLHTWKVQMLIEQSCIFMLITSLLHDLVTQRFLLIFYNITKTFSFQTTDNSKLNVR